MQENLLWGLIAGITLVLLIVTIVVRKKYPHPTDYYSFFWIGLLWMLVGIPMAFFGEENYFFFIMGIVFALIGWKNKDKWKKNRVRWKDLKKPEKVIQGILIALLAFIIAAGIAFLLMR